MSSIGKAGDPWGGETSKRAAQHIVRFPPRQRVRRGAAMPYAAPNKTLKLAVSDRVDSSIVGRLI
jgi:hypothetical protein